MTINNYRAHWISGVIMECIIEESGLQMIEIFSIWKNHLYSYVNVLIYFFKNIVLFVRKLFSWFHNSKQSCQSPLKWWNSTNVLCREKQTINVVFDQLSRNRKQKWKHEIRKAFRIEMFVVSSYCVRNTIAYFIIYANRRITETSHLNSYIIEHITTRQISY